MSAPIVESVTPAQGAGSVAVGSTVVWNLDQNIDETTVTASTAYLTKDPAGTPTAVAAALVVVNDAITLTPSAPLTAGATYLATLVGGTTGVKASGAEGERMAATYTSTFTVAPAAASYTVDVPAGTAYLAGTAVTIAAEGTASLTAAQVRQARAQGWTVEAV